MLELRYDRALRVAEIRIFEVDVPGAVVAVEVVDDTGRETRQWSVENPASRPGTFKVKPPAGIDFAAKTVRLTLDAARRKGRNGIDTVQLVGTDGTSLWPIDAVVVN